MNGHGGYPTPMRVDLDRFRDGLLEVRRRLADVRATAESDDGLVEATVGGRGELLELTLDPRLYRNTDARALAEDILGTVRRAAEIARDEVSALTEDALRAEADHPVSRRPEVQRMA